MTAILEMLFQNFNKFMWPKNKTFKIIESESVICGQEKRYEGNQQNLFLYV